MGTLTKSKNMSSLYPSSTARPPNSTLKLTKTSLSLDFRSLTLIRWADRAMRAGCRLSQRAAFPESATLRPMTDAARLLEAALQLAPRERAELVEALTASLDGSDLGEAWESEIRQRIADVDAGRVQPVPGEQVFSRIEQRLRDR